MYTKSSFSFDSHTDAFPPPRDFAEIGQIRATNLSRAVFLSRLRQERQLQWNVQRYKVLIIVLILIAVVLIANVVIRVFEDTSPETATMSIEEKNDFPKSTDKYLWVQGTTPYLYQADPKWASEPYADGKIETHGCGPVSLSMVYVRLTGKRDMDPVAMARFSEREGYVDAGVTSWLLMSQGSSKLGLKARELGADPALVCERLLAGNPIICSMGPGDFTDNGHFIVLSGIDSDGKLIVRDPNSVSRSFMHWDAERVISQCRNIWEFSLA